MTQTTGEKIMNLRQKRGLSQEEFGEMLGVSRQAVSKWETSQAMPDVDKIVAMSKIFGVTTDYLLKENEETQDQYTHMNDSDKEENVSSESTEASLFTHIKKLRFEYKSKTTVFGVPLVHIKTGRAKGIFAIGFMATGVVSLGFLSLGLLSWGLLSLGLIALGTFAAGGLAIGGVAAGIVAIGGVALGVFTIGGLSVGVYSMGGCAIASKIAFGGYAQGYIAIGDKTAGQYTWCVKDGFPDGVKEEVYRVIQRELPNTPKFIMNLFR